jgi:hypothetical protein
LHHIICTMARHLVEYRKYTCMRTTGWCATVASLALYLIRFVTNHHALASNSWLNDHGHSYCLSRACFHLPYTRFMAANIIPSHPALNAPVTADTTSLPSIEPQNALTKQFSEQEWEALKQYRVSRVSQRPMSFLFRSNTTALF